MNLIALRFMFKLLKHFLRHDICCHIGNAFATYIAGLQTSFQRVLFFIVLKESPLLNLLFQRGETPRETFYLGHFHFTLYQNLQHIDVCRYVVRRGSLQYYFSFLGIDSSIECGTKSNVDFIHFVWRNLEAQFAFRRHAITILPDQDGFTTRLLCMRYDVPSAGWTYSSGCTICCGVARVQVRPFTGCLAPAEACSCTICTRRPPSLKALAFHSYFALVRNIEQFRLTRRVRYSQYRAAYCSGRVDIAQLLPPDFPAITLIHTFTSCPSRPPHSTCFLKQITRFTGMTGTLLRSCLRKL